MHPSPSNIHQNLQIKPVSKPTIHIKQEGGRSTLLEISTYSGLFGSSPFQANKNVQE